MKTKTPRNTRIQSSQNDCMHFRAFQWRSISQKYINFFPTHAISSFCADMKSDNDVSFLGIATYRERKSEKINISLCLCFLLRLSLNDKTSERLMILSNCTVFFFSLLFHNTFESLENCQRTFFNLFF